MKTIARRNKVLGQVRGIVSGNDSSEQLQHELRRMGKEERQHLLRREGITINIPPEAGVAMKADLAIPWTKLRVIKRYPATLLHIQICTVGDYHISQVAEGVGCVRL